MLLISLLIALTVLSLNTAVNSSEIPKDCDNLLIEVLKEIVGPLRSKTTTKTPIPSFRRRCRDNLACEYLLPVIEADNVMFRNGELYLSDYGPKTISLIQESHQYFAAKSGHLPSSLVQLGMVTDWLPGPVINHDVNGIRACNNSFEDISAQFLFPWEINNAFHTVNDNVFAALGSTILNYLTSPVVPGGSPVDAAQDTGTPGFDVDRLKNTSYVLYLFRSVGRKDHSVTLMYKLLPLIYGRERVKRASEVISRTRSRLNLKASRRPINAAIRCLKHLTWGAALKVFLRDSLVDLRRVIFDVLHLLLKKQEKCDKIKNKVNQFDSHIINDQTLLDIEKIEKDRILPTKNMKKPKVVIVTRNTTSPTKSTIRKLTASTEARLSSYYTQLGFDVIICCDFKYLNSISQVIEYFRDVDICVGIHGAGLTNCIFGRHGMVVVELQNSYNYGLDSFLKVAHMAGGHYLFYDLRSSPVLKGSKKTEGIDLNSTITNSIVDISVRLHLFSRLLYRDNETFKQVLEPKEGSKEHSRSLFGFNDSSSDMKNRKFNSMTRNINRKLLINRKNYKNHETNYNGFIVIDLTSKNYFMEKIDKKMEIIVKDIFKFPGYNLNDIGFLKDLYEGETSGNGIFWVFLNPSIKPYTKDSILGPKLSETSKFCFNLPYFKFRSQTSRSKILECDKRKFLRKPSGSIEHKLLQNFV